MHNGVRHPGDTHNGPALLLTAVAAFAGGFLAGLLVAPPTRRRLTRRVAGSSRWLTHQLKAMERELDALEDRLQQAGARFGEKARSAAHDALEPYVPSIPDDDEAWRLQRDDLTHDLRRLPRR